MEPTEIYHRNKRSLFIFLGLLVLVVLGGVEVKSAPESSLLPVHVKDPAMLQHVLFVISLYCFYQFVLAWFYQPDAVREKVRLDFILSLVLSILAGLLYISNVLRPIVEGLSFNSEYLFSIGSAIFASITASLASYTFLELSRRRQQVFEIRGLTIEERLLTAGWALLFDPSRERSKGISFNRDGTIGEGRNSNEFSWKLKEHKALWIWRENGDLQNQFSYDEMTDRFLFVHNPEAKGLAGQIIFRRDEQST